MKCDLILHNIGRLATCSAPNGPKRGADMLDTGIVSGAAVAITDGIFVGIGTSKQILAEFAADESVDVANKAAVPGFVDPHTHIVFAGDRLDEFELKIKGAEYLEILAAGGGIISTVKNTREAS